MGQPRLLLGGTRLPGAHNWPSAYRVHCRCMRPCERTNVCGRLVTQKKRVTPSFLVRRWRRVQGRSFVKIKDIAPHPADKVDPRRRFFPGKVLEAVTCVSDVPMWGAGADDGVGWLDRGCTWGVTSGQEKGFHGNSPRGGPEPRPASYLFLQFLQVSPLGLQLVLQLPGSLKHST